MKEIIKIDYYCDYCGKHFKDKDECAEHENECKVSHPRISREYAKKIDALIKEADKLGVKLYVPEGYCGDVGAVVYDCEKGKMVVWGF